jgi:asparagine synthase (glutamine-hydrolysing)
MCGISGLFNVGATHIRLSEPAAILRGMTERMVHRGPDASGEWTDSQGRCLLGHRRLSIIDTSDAGRQPMTSANGRWVITFNGEIYNFQELRLALAAEGTAVRGRTDTEVLIESIALWGIEALSKLDGMFAFGAFNIESGELLLARDPFGEKPLYYMELPGGGLAFASELQALEQVPGFDNDVSLDAMGEVLMFQYIGAPRTIYRAVKKLPPGHWLSARLDAEPRVGRYFEFLPGASGFDNRPIHGLADELEDILARSIKRRLISDVPLGAFLSGGVDSSTVCALVRKKLGLSLKTFSIGFKGAPESEHEAARAFAGHLGTEHHDRILAPDASEFLLGIGRILDEPNGDSSCMPTYLLSRFARQQVTVALSGDGGDEMFGGYGRYFITLDEESVHGGRGPGIWQPGRAYYSNRILVSTEKYIEELFGFVPDGLTAHVGRLRTQLNQPAPPLFCRLRKTDVDNYMPGAVLPKVDRMSMQHSLEVRTPFLNVELARFAEKLSPDVLYHNGRGKLVLRELAYRYLPKELIDAPKKGFGIPMSRWGRDALLGVASQMLESDDSRLSHALGQEAINRFLKGQRGFGGFAAYQVWAIAMLESWLRHHPAKLPAFAAPSRLAARSSPAARPPARSPSTLSAWQLDTRLFAVLENGSVRLDGSQPLADGDSAYQAEVTRNVLRMVLCARGRQDDPENGPTQLKLRRDPVRIPGWGQSPTGYLTGEDKRLFDGATVIFPEPGAAQYLDSAEMRKFEKLGAQALVFAHRFRDGGALVRLTLRPKSWWGRLAAALRLSRHMVARIGPLARAKAFVRFKLTGDQTNWRFNAGPFPRIANIPETELSGRYMLFEGFRQLPPVPVSHEEIARGGGGRYSIWSQQCVFSPTRASNLLALPYWIVERNPRTERFLQIVPEFLTGDSTDHAQWLTKVEQWIAMWEKVTFVKRCGSKNFTLHPRDRVVVLTHALPPGGAERQWCYLAIGLKSAGFTVTFVTIDRLQGPNAHYLPLLLNAGIEVIDIGKQPLAQVLRYLPKDTESRSVLSPNPNPFHASLDLLTSLLVHLSPKVVFAQLDSPNLIAATAAHLAGVPRVVLSFRNYNPSHFSYLRNDWFRPCYQAVCRSPRALLAGNATACNEDYANWIGVPAERIAWIPNAIDPKDFGIPHQKQINQLASELQLDEAAPVILGIFRLSEEKQPLLFVEVCSRVARIVKDVRVLVVGVGPLRKDMEDAINKLGLEGVISLLGSRHDVPALMKIASLLLLTSSHEGMPNVVMEAQLSGLPVVATNVGGVPDLIRDGETGFLASPGDVDALVNACVRLLRNKELMVDVSRRASDRMLRDFSRKMMIDRYLALVDPVSYSATTGPAALATHNA